MAGPEAPVEAPQVPAVPAEEIPPERVAYLWGAGATQAEVNNVGAAILNLLMRDRENLGLGIASRILEKLPDKWKSAFTTDKGLDVEKVISLLSGSGLAEHLELADQMRRLYFEDICQKLAQAQVLTNPKLATALLLLHKNDTLRKTEVLTGLLTTNHDGLLQLASQNVFGSVNIGVPFTSTELVPSTNGTVPLLHLHGSFTWTFGLPLKVALLQETSAYSPNTVWIPPTILKESKSYPFNRIVGAAYEILSRHCDVLRVVGSSLTQNDWNVLSLIFNAQRHRESVNEAPFRVELIMSQESGEQIMKECSYIRHLILIGFLTDGDFEGYKTGELTADMRNPLYYWLQQKVRFHQNKGQLGDAPLDPVLAQLVGDAP